MYNGVASSIIVYNHKNDIIRISGPSKTLFFIIKFETITYNQYNGTSNKKIKNKYCYA